MTEKRLPSWLDRIHEGADAINLEIYRRREQENSEDSFDAAFEQANGALIEGHDIQIPAEPPQQSAEVKEPTPKPTEEPKPWPEEVKLPALLKKLTDTLDAYTILPSHASSAIALWVIFAHAHDAFWISPILSIESPEKRCGKSRLLDVIELAVPRGHMSGNMSVATIFRICEQRKPTFVWDEIKRFITPEKSELIGLLETGYRRRSAWVDRCESENKKITTRRFSTWCPKCVALKGNIGQIADTLEDRSIRIRMRRKLTSEQTKELRQDRIQPFVDLCRQGMRWANDNLERLRNADPEVPEELHDRARDNWRPLLAIAELAGGNWPEKARNAAKVISGASDDEESGGVLVLAHCKEVFATKNLEYMRPTDLVHHLCSDEEWPWATWRNGRDPITTHGLSKLLKPFGIKSEKSGARAYHRKSFEEAWSRYL